MWIRNHEGLAKERKYRFIVRTDCGAYDVIMIPTMRICTSSSFFNLSSCLD
jgi:hypothetical protein